MIIQLDPRNFSVFWPMIRQGVLKTSVLPPELYEEYAKNVLSNLLSGMFQTWLVFEWEGDEKKIHACLVTSLQVDDLTSMKYLYIESIYGYRPMTPELNLETSDELVKFAESQGCKTVRCHSGNPRIFQILKEANFKEVTRIFEREV
jgi:hypothetical protein